MNYGLCDDLTSLKGECLILGLCEHGEIPKSLKPGMQDLVMKLFKKLSEKGHYLWHHEHEAQSLLLVHCGKQEEFTSKELQKRLKEICAQMMQHRLSTATLALPQVKEKSPEWQLEQMILQVDNAYYQMLEFKKKKSKPHPLEYLSFYLPGASEERASLAKAIADGVRLTRDLANQPANICTPTYLGEQAEQLSKAYPAIKTRVLGPDKIKELGMNTLLAVAQGSSEEARFIEIQYQGGAQEAPIVLVGKGITFDSGGLSIKPANGMDEMKYDMSGAAAVLGTLKACAELKMPINLVGLIPAAENMVSGQAVKPGDIVTSMSGQTVEIINTDAEGRLVLADALCYAERFKPRFVIDIATLTGAMVVALGAVRTGFMTRDEEIAKNLIEAGQESGDPVWRMPLDEDYEEALESPMADMLNSTFDRSAGSITAACFLARFTDKYPWAHLDIAGTAWISGKNRNATGRPVPLLTQLIRHVAKSH